MRAWQRVTAWLKRERRAEKHIPADPLEKLEAEIAEREREVERLERELAARQRLAQAKRRQEALKRQMDALRGSGDDWLSRFLGG